MSKSIVEAISAVIAADRIPYLEGPPGWGKSSILKTLAVKKNAKLFIVYLAQVAGNEIHGIPVVNKELLTLGERQFTVVEQAPPRWAVEAAQMQNAIIFFDEVNQVSPSDQGQLMSILTERLVGSVHLDRSRIAIVAAGNPPEMSAGGWKFTPPARRRFVKLDMRLDPIEFASMDAFPSNWGYDLPPVVKFGNELPVNLRVKYRNMLAAYVRSRPNCFELPKDLGTMSEGFVCPATIEDSADLLAATEAFVEKSLQGEIRHQLLAGSVGIAAAADILTFLDLLDVPNADDLLDDPTNFVSSPRTIDLDKLYYLLMSLGEAMRFRTRKTTESSSKAVLTRAQTSWQNAIKIATYLQANSAPKDLLCMFVGFLVRADVRPKQVVPPKEVAELIETLSVLKASGLSSTELANFGDAS